MEHDQHHHNIHNQALLDQSYVENDIFHMHHSQFSQNYMNMPTDIHSPMQQTEQRNLSTQITSHANVEPYTNDKNQAVQHQQELMDSSYLMLHQQHQQHHYQQQVLPSSPMTPPVAESQITQSRIMFKNMSPSITSKRATIDEYVGDDIHDEQSAYKL